MSIHSTQNKNNCFISVGDIVKLTVKSSGETFIGKIVCIDIRKQTGTDITL